jgi:peroxiredoxin
MSYTVLGNVAPDLPLKDTADKDFSIHKNIDPKAKYTLIYFWTPSCGHCRKETPEVHKLYLKYKDKGFDVISIFTETDTKSWKKYIQENKLSWKNAYDPEKENKTRHYSKSMSVVYDIMSTPQLFLIDSDRKIVLKKINHEQLDKFLEDTLIKGKK